jgi:hypothetical protein
MTDSSFDRAKLIAEARQSVAKIHHWAFLTYADDSELGSPTRPYDSEVLASVQERNHIFAICDELDGLINAQVTDQ